MIKILLLTLLCIQIIFPQLRQVSSFDQLFTYLKNGYEIRVVVEYQKCKLFIDSSEVNSINAIGGMNISTFEYFAKGSIRNEKAFISFSENILISHTRYGYVYNYVKFRIYEDNSIEIIARYLKPDNYEIVMDETFYCEIANSSNNGGVYFYLMERG